jgi:hypothetical protein
MTELEQWRKIFNPDPRFYFAWSIKKRFDSPEQSFNKADCGLIITYSSIVSEAAKSLAEGIEQWLKSPKSPKTYNINRQFFNYGAGSVFP